MIRCTACGFENDDTRVYCQNCGVKLVVPEGATVPEAPVRDVRRKVGRPQLRKPGPAATSLTLALGREILLMAILAAILAGLIQALRPPDDLPPAVPARPAMASLLAADIQAAIESPYPRSVEVSGEAANNFLVSRVTGVAEGGGIFRARLARAYVVPREGWLNFGVEQRLGGHSVYLQLAVRPVAEAGRTGAEIFAGSIGRLAVPKPVVSFFARSFHPVLDALGPAPGWMEKASAVEIIPAGATLRWPGRSD